MASSLKTLTATYQEISDTPATIQKITDNIGTVFIAFGTSAPTNDNASFIVNDNESRFFTTADKIYARAQSKVTVKLVVGA